MIIVIAVVAILALLAIPSFMDKVMRDQIKESKPLLEFAKDKVVEYYKANNVMPADNAQAGMPPPDKIVNNVVKSVTVEGGAVTVKFGNNAHPGLQDKQVTWRPMVPDQPGIPISSWACNTKPAAGNSTLHGRNLTDVAPNNLPFECRGPATAQ